MTLNKTENEFEVIYQELYPLNIKELIDDDSILHPSEQLCIINHAIATVAWSIIDSNTFPEEDPSEIVFQPPSVPRISNLMEHPPFLSAVNQAIIKRQNMDVSSNTSVTGMFSLGYIYIVASDLWRNVAISLTIKTLGRVHKKALEIINKP